jgi:mRNA deadenylase 3'-5' endonuclease subunit Ccr4
MKYLHYNIFAKSLGSNSIPWVMTVSLEWKLRIEELTQLPYHHWVKEICTKEYLKHFHKNHTSGNKILMRKLWSQNILNSTDVPVELDGVRYVSENCIEYQIDQQVYHATTLPGLLRKSLSHHFGHDLYTHIMNHDQYYNWNLRGPCLYQTILAIQPDLISLCEYDIHEALASYRESTQGEETFDEAMRATGYSGLFLKSPDLIGGSGLGIFWKIEEFELVDEGDSESSFLQDSFQLPRTSTPSTAIIPIDTEYHGVISNYDLHEHWHKLIPSTSSPSSSSPFTQCPGSGSGFSSRYEEMSRKDRHHVGMIRLRHKPSKKVLLMVATHLMTSSRDCELTNEYPGEVRLGEMETIGKKISSYLQRATDDMSPTSSSSSSSRPGAIDAIIYSGDFNLDIRQLDRLHDGIPSIITPPLNHPPPPMKHFQTGFTKDSLPLSPGECTGPYLKYHPHPKWNLFEAFESIHQWGVDGRVGYGQYCTSYNSERCEWIDMIWYTNQSLVLKNLSSMDTPLTPIPNEVHASDHLPLCAEFEWR